MSLPPVSPTTATLVAPSWALSSCVRAYIIRSTLGVPLQPHERLNHYPFTPTCDITWSLQGKLDLLLAGNGDTTPKRLPRIGFTGPQTGPTVTSNPGPAHSLILLLLPDALHAMSGVDVSAYVDRKVPLDEVFGTDWCAMAEAVQEAPDDSARIQLIEDFLLPRWQAVKRQGMVPVHTFDDWARNLALRAVISGMGRSMRQMERRIRVWTGQSMRSLYSDARAENALFLALDEAKMNDGQIDWTRVADEAGFTDQSHFCREVRRRTGYPPNELKRRVQEDESFWIYRIWA